MKITSEPRSDQITISTIGRVLLAGVFMFGFALALVYGYRLAAGDPSDTPVIELPLIILATGVGGGIAVRVARLSWRQVALAALLSALGLILYARFEPSFPGPWIPAGSGMEFDLVSALSYLVIGTAGVFLLPLFDPAVRRAGSAPSLARVILVAVTLTVLAVLVDYLVGGGSFFGLLTLVFGSIAAALLAGAGLILALVNVTAVGAWLGGLGLVLEAFIVAAWWLLGSRWFP